MRLVGNMIVRMVKQTELLWYKGELPMNAPMRKFIFKLSDGRLVNVIAESKFAAKRKMDRDESIPENMERRLLSFDIYKPEKV